MIFGEHIEHPAIDALFSAPLSSQPLQGADLARWMHGRSDSILLKEFGLPLDLSAKRFGIQWRKTRQSHTHCRPLIL